MLSPRMRTLYGRQVLLPEVGEAGQSKLLSARLCLSREANAGVAAVCADYLMRAGVSVTADPEAADPHPAATSAEVSALCGDAAWARPAAEVLLGAFAAVEAIKALTGAGTPGSVPNDFRLTWED